MITVQDIYKEAKLQNASNMMLFIEYLVEERKVISYEDDHTKLDYFTQDKFRKKMIEYLSEYEAKRNQKAM